MPPTQLYNLDEIDLATPLFTLEEIRAVNPQRFEMEQLTAIVHMDEVEKGVVGYKDVTPDEFWVRGHMPDFPLMPGVILCEAAAQLAGFFARKTDLLGSGDFLGFGGIESAAFRRPVHVGDRLVLMAKVTEVRPRRMAKFDFQGFVDGKMVLSGGMKGVPIDASPAAKEAANTRR